MIRKIEESSGAARGGARWLLCVCLAAAASSGFPAVAQDQPRLERPLFEARVFSDGDILLVPVELQGKTYQFMVDTGTVTNAYDCSLREQLGPASGRIWVNAPENQVDIVRPANVSIRGLAVDPTGLVMDLGPFRRATGYEFHGIIGVQNLAQHIVAIDPDRGAFSLLPAVPDDAGEKVDILFRDNLPFVGGIVPGFKDEWFMLDTGAAAIHSGCLRDEFAASLLTQGLAAPGPDFGKIVDVLGKASKGGTKVLSRVTVGPFEHRSLLFSSDKKYNTLAMGMLMRYRIVLDFPNKTAYFKPSKFFDAVDRIGFCGIGLRRAADGSVNIVSVASGSPASLAGIRPGDELLSVGPHDCRTARRYVVGRALHEAGKTVRTVVKRGEQRLAFRVKIASREAKPLQSGDAEDARTLAGERTEGRSDAQAFTNTLGMKFKRIPAGEFLMGDDESLAELKEAFGSLAEGFDISNEHPRHKVRITRPFYIGVYEVA